MLILGIESSCDETSAAVVETDGKNRKILSDIIASQVDTHRLYGGVVPEIASRAHAEAISRITYDALEKAGVTLDKIGAVGVTNTPGLIGALLVGVNFAKALAVSNNIPLIAVDHIRGHIAANYLTHPDLNPPFLALVASGGHTSIIKVNGYTDFETIGATRDDAIGEAFDKVGRVMGLEYPAGAKMDALASKGRVIVKFPSAAIHGENLDFSFSGLKTAVINYLHNKTQSGENFDICDVAASFTECVALSVRLKTEAALTKTGLDRLVLSGGVAANSHLRDALSSLCEKLGVDFFVPDLSLCGDNAAMIAAQAYYEYADGNTASPDLNAFA